MQCGVLKKFVSLTIDHRSGPVSMGWSDIDASIIDLY